MEVNMKTLNCRDAGFDCEAKVQAASDEEILAQAAVHARETHKVEVTPEMADQIRTLIHDEPEAAGQAG
jgi:predicted small metal-binding protein